MLGKVPRENLDAVDFLIGYLSFLWPGQLFREILVVSLKLKFCIQFWVICCCRVYVLIILCFVRA